MVLILFVLWVAWWLLAVGLVCYLSGLVAACCGSCLFFEGPGGCLLCVLLVTWVAWWLLAVSLVCSLRGLVAACCGSCLFFGVAWWLFALGLVCSWSGLVAACCGSCLFFEWPGGCLLWVLFVLWVAWWLLAGSCKAMVCDCGFSWISSVQFCSSPQVIKLFSCSTQLSMKFVLLINLNWLTIANSFLLNMTEHETFSANKYENANFLKMPTFVGIFIFISRENFLLSWVEHEECFYNLEARFLRILLNLALSTFTLFTLSIQINSSSLCETLLMSTHNICFYPKIRKNMPELSPNIPLNKSSELWFNVKCFQQNDWVNSIQFWIEPFYFLRQTGSSLSEMLLMSTHNICFYHEIRKTFPKLSTNIFP